MKKIYISVLSMFVIGCTAFTPSAYIEKEECDLGDELSFKAACYGGYSTTRITDSKLLVTFEGNEFTTLQRATDLAIYHCSQLALSYKNKFMTINVIERKVISLVNASNDNAFTSTYPISSIYCDISNVKTDNNIEALTTSIQMKAKYKI